MKNSARDLQLALDAEEAHMRAFFGLDENSKPIKGKKKRGEKVAVRQQMEVALRCYNTHGDEITFWHYEKSVSGLLAECEARKRARGYGLDVLFTESVELKEYPVVLGSRRR